MHDAINPIAEFICQQPVTSLAYCGESESAVKQLLGSTALKIDCYSYEQILDLKIQLELTLLYDCLEHLSGQSGKNLIGHLRNVLSPRIWVIESGSSNWHFTDFVAYGFKSNKPITLNGQPYNSYYYDIASYNKKRDWNNSSKWANPDNWNKYRW